MDVNQTRFHLVYGRKDWPDAPLVDWNETDSTLTLHKELFIFDRPKTQSPLAMEDRRGSGRDRYGNFYWITEDRTELRFLGNSRSASELFWPHANSGSSEKEKTEFFSVVEPVIERRLMSGLAVTADHYLIVGVLNPPGLLVFDLHGGGPPLEFSWPAGVRFAPWDIAASSDGDVWILDRTNRALWHLDRYFRVSSEGSNVQTPAENDFEAATGKLQQEQVQYYSSRITSNLALPLAATADPVAIEALADGSVVVLDNPEGEFFSVLHRYRSGQPVAAPLPLDHALDSFVHASSDPHAGAVRGHDIAVAGSSLFIAGIDGEQVFAFEIDPAKNAAWLKAVARYFPMRSFQGKAIISAGDVVYYDFAERWWQLTEQPRARYVPQAQIRIPNIEVDEENPALDGKEPQCVWHRLLMEASIPPGAAVTVESRAHDSQDSLADTPWQKEPLPYMRGDGPEIPFYRSPLSGPGDRVGTWELLFQNARGRYLQLRLTLNGTGRNTPRLHALRVYYPRFSYLRQYLPAVYQDDAGSASFLDRYLANVEGFYTAIEGRMEQVQQLFDTRTAPAEYLDWLAGWVGLTLDLGWSESTRRMVLSHAAQMFRQRGTRAGIIRAMRLALDACPDDSIFRESVCRSYNCAEDKIQAAFTVRVVERFLTRNAPGVVYGDVTDVLGPGSTTSSSDWTPQSGAGPLHESYREYLNAFYESVENLNEAWGTQYSGFDDPSLLLPPIQPSGKTRIADWQRFLRSALGFTYTAVTPADTEAYRQFLARQYRTIADLNAAYDLTGADAKTSFASIALPGALPPGGRRLQDWIRFVSMYMPTHRNAHRFTVLVPVTEHDSPDTQTAKLGVAKRVVELEKPAHTAFDVRLYWGMFRAGEARVGLDTILGRGSRSVALVLGRDYLAAGHLAYVEPWNIPDRMTIEGKNTTGPCCGQQPRERCT